MSTETSAPATRAADPVLTPQELADRLGISLRTVRNWRARGTDPVAIKVGHFIRYKLSDVEAWEEAHRERR